MKRLLFIVNPKAGKLQIKNSFLNITDLFTKAGYQVTVYPTQGHKDAENIVEREAGGYDLLVCAGGDGTLDEVVTGLMRSGKRVPLGYIPAGSTNDYGKSLGIPAENFSAASNIIKGSPFSCDIGMFNEDYFVYIAAFGAFTGVSYSTSQQTKNMVGHLAYLLEGAKSLPSIKSYHVKVEYDNHFLEDDYIFGMISNSISVGGFKSFRGNEVEFDDGLFEGLFIKRPKNPIELQAIIGALLMGDVNENYMHFFKAASVFVSSERMHWTLDGEYGGDHEQVRIRNIPKAIDIIRYREIKA